MYFGSTISFANDATSFTDLGFLMIEEFIETAVSWNCALGDTDRVELLAKAKEQLKCHPELGDDPIVAIVTGVANTVSDAIDSDSTFANQSLSPRDWNPLSYLCFSRFWTDADSESESNLLRVAGLLLDAGADPNGYFLLEGDKETCLYGAVGVAGNAALTSLLVQHGAEVNEGEVAYHVAEFPGASCATVLFDAGLSPSHRATVLLRKLDFDDLEGTREILELGADPDGMGIWGKTPLHQAIMRGRSLETIKLILGYGADPNINRNDGKTTMQLAAETGRSDLIAMLRTA